MALVRDPYRFKVVSAGRRSGKTERAKRFLAKQALKYPKTRYFIAAPIRPQVKLIYWDDMCALLKPFIKGKPNLTELKITLVNGSIIQMFGLGGGKTGNVGATRIEGSPWHGGIIDEYANCPPKVFDHSIRPALAEFKGWCWFIGVPEGRNHYYDLHLRGMSGQHPDWSSYTWDSADILDPEEVAAAEAEMDARTFRQEFMGSFESYAGLLYYNWDDRYIVNVVADPAAPLRLSCDFNKSPMLWDIYQIESVKRVDQVRAVDEIYLPFNAKTQQAAHQFVKQFADHLNKTVYINGDAANKYESTRDWSSDYTIIQTIFKEGGWKPVFNVPAANPSINNRVNVACSMLQHDRILVSPKCKWLINDLQRNESDGKGAKDKTDPAQTHASDNLDYFIWANFSAEFYGNKVRQL